MPNSALSTARALLYHAGHNITTVDLASMALDLARRVVAEAADETSAIAAAEDR